MQDDNPGQDHYLLALWREEGERKTEGNLYSRLEDCLAHRSHPFYWLAIFFSSVFALVPATAGEFVSYIFILDLLSAVFLHLFFFLLLFLSFHIVCC